MPQEVYKNIWRIVVPLPKNPLKILNSYVIKGSPGERNLLIDTGFKNSECMDALSAGLNELEVNMSETDILLTHLHSDHTGLAPEIAVQGTRVFLSRAEIPWMFGDTRRKHWRRDNERVMRAGFDPELVRSALQKAPSREMSSDISFEDFLPIDDGDVFHCGGYSLKAVATPGHTPVHMCFWMKQQRVMFTGDHVLFDISPNITLWNDVEDSLGDYLRSLRMIDSYDVVLALPGHRETGDFHSRIAQLLEHHQKRLEECFKVVSESPHSSVYEIAGKMSWKIRCSSWDDFPLSQKWFAVGECHSHLRHLEKQGRVLCNYDNPVITFTVR